MALIQFLITLALIIVFNFGQLLRVTLFSISFPVIDIFILLLASVNLLNHILSKKITSQNKYFLYFICFSLVSLLANLIFFHYPFVKPLFYFLRFTALLSFIVFPLFSKNNLRLKSFFRLAIISNILFGLIQYFFWPDFTFFNSLNWDPHLYRLVSSFFDPTFTALIYLFFLIYLFLNKPYPSIINRLLIIITYVAISLTYSRSTFLSLIFAFIYISFKTGKKYLSILSIVLVGLTILILPRQPGEGTKLERTSSIFAKIENYKEGVGVFSTSPIIGHGYNNLQYIRYIDKPQSHSNSGFDSSLLTILCTSGIIGFALFIHGSKLYFQKSSLITQSMIVALAVHSLFANSLFYPWVILFLVLI